MSDTVQVEIQGSAEVQAFVKGIPDHLYGGAKTAFSNATFAAQKEVQNNLAGNPLHSRSGNLAKSILPEVQGASLPTLSGRIYSGMIYAPIQEKGGEVVAKNKYMGMPGGPYLNIPAPDNKTPAGVQRMTAQQVFAAGGKIAARSRMEWGAGGGLGVYLDDVLMFTLVKKVTIKGGLGMEKAGDNQITPLLAELSAMPLE